MSTPAQNLQILHLEVDRDGSGGDYRILVDGKHIKYISIEGGIYPPEDMCFLPVLIPQLPAFPPGDWNVGHIAKSADANGAVFAWTRHESLPSIQSDWHPLHIDYLDLSIDEYILSNVRIATSSHFDKPVIAKFANFAWEIDYYGKETEVYSWIQGASIAPRFLGHITEADRKIGFLLEKIEGRNAEPDDLKLCEDVLNKLHALGIVHNDVNKYNFIISEGRAWLVDFESATKCNDRSVMDREMASLVQQLAEESGRGGVIEEGSRS